MVYIKRRRLGRLCRTAFPYQKEPKMDQLKEVNIMFIRNTNFISTFLERHIKNL